MARAGYGAAAAAACVTYGSFRYLLDRILLARTPNYRRLFDKLTPADTAAQHPLTPARAWALLGPHATRATLREFWRCHGMRCLSVFLAAMWTVVVTPVAQAKAEAAYAFRGDPMAWGRERRAREDSARQEAAAIARRSDPELQAALRARDELALGNTGRSGATVGSGSNPKTAVRSDSGNPGAGR
jgi:hypothetical protein